MHEGKNTGIKVAGNQALCRKGGLGRGVREGRGVIGGGREERKAPLPIHGFLSLPIFPIPVFAPAMQAKGREMVKPRNAISCVRA